MNTTSLSVTLPDTYDRYYFQVYATNATGQSSPATLASPVRGVTIKELDFSQNEPLYRNDGSGAYPTTQQWFAGNLDNQTVPDPSPTENDPLAYPIATNKNGTVTVVARLSSMAVQAGGKWMIEGSTQIGDQTLTFGPTALGGGGGNAPNSGFRAKLTSSMLPTTIQASEMTIDWEVSENGGKTWASPGTTENYLYLTGARFMSVGADANKPDKNAFTPYETLVALGCMAASGDTPGVDNADILNKIYCAFQTLDVQQIHNGVPYGPAMTYWGRTQSGAPGAGNPPPYFTTAGLITNSDGRCDSWAHFFADVAYAEGVTGVKLIDVSPPKKGEDLLVKNVPAQGNANPKQYFNAHVIVLWKQGAGATQTDALFDPSYGAAEIDGTGANIGIAVGAQWELASLAGLLVDATLAPLPWPPAGVVLGVTPICTFNPEQP